MNETVELRKFCIAIAAKIIPSGTGNVIALAAEIEDYLYGRNLPVIKSGMRDQTPEDNGPF